MSALAETLIPSIVEVGKIKIGCLGPERKTQDGRTWRPPVKLDHFLVTTLHRDASGQLTPDVALMQSLAPFADQDGKLRTIPVMLPSNDLDEVMQSTHVWYVGKKLGARRDGRRVTFFFDPTTGQPLAEPKIAGWSDSYLDESDPLNQSRKLFKRFTTLNVMIASGTARWGGLYKFRTTGDISARQLYGSLLSLRGYAAGQLRGPIFRLIVRPLNVTPEGKPTTVHVVHVEYVADDPQSLLRQAQEYLALETATAEAVATAHRQYKALLAAAADEPPDDDEALEPLQLPAAGGPAPSSPPPPEKDASERQAAILERMEADIKGAATPEAIEQVRAKILKSHSLGSIDHGQLSDKMKQVDARKAEIIGLAADPDPYITDAPPPSPSSSPPAAEPKPETAEQAAEKFKICNRIETLCVDLGQSWGDVRAEYAEALGITCTRVKDVTLDQARKLQEILSAELQKRGALSLLKKGPSSRKVPQHEDRRQS